MKYLENSIKILGRFYILALPLYLLSLIPSLIHGAGTSDLTDRIKEIVLDFHPGRFSNLEQLMNIIPSLFVVVLGTGILSWLLKFIVYPATYGMVDKILSRGQADLKYFMPALEKNFVKYLVYFGATLVVGIIAAIAIVIIFLFLGLIASILKPIGIAFIFLALIALCLAAIVINILLCLWLPSMIVENLDVFSALKRSVQIAKSNFWMLLGISLLIWLATAVLSAILGLIFGWIPVISTLVLSLVPAISEFIFITFLLSVYKEQC